MDGITERTQVIGFFAKRSSPYPRDPPYLARDPLVLINVLGPQSPSAAHPAHRHGGLEHSFEPFHHRETTV